MLPNYAFVSGHQGVSGQPGTNERPPLVFEVQQTGNGWKSAQRSYSAFPCPMWMGMIMKYWEMTKTWLS